MTWLHSLTFASEADLIALTGLAFLLLAALSLLADRMRMRRSRLEKVGWMPWTPIFLACMIIGGGLLALSMPQVIGGWL